jgi:hypothetical protein
MTSTPLGHKKCLDKWGAVNILITKIRNNYKTLEKENLFKL